MQDQILDWLVRDFHVLGVDGQNWMIVMAVTILAGLILGTLFGRVRAN